MNTNIVNDITDIYFGQIVVSEALDPVGKEDGDVDNDGKKNTKSDQYLLNRRKAVGKAISTQEAKEVKRWWDDDGDGSGYEKGEVGGKFKKKKKEVKEGFSNWREDLSEVMSTIEKEENDEEIVEKKVKNNIKINPSMGEAVEGLGGTLLEMTEIEDFEEVFDELSESDIFFLTDDLIEEVVEEVFEECLQEGYNIFEIENVLLESLEVSSALLNEAKVTYGHDTDVKSDRLEKVKSAVKKVGKGILRGAGYVAGAAVRGAKAVGRELGAGYKRGRYGSGGSSDSDSSSRSSSSDGQSRVTQGRGSSRPGLLGRIGSALKKGLRRIIHKGAKAVERGAGSVARRTADNDGVRTPSPRSGIGKGKKIEVTGSKASKVTQGKGKPKTVEQEEPIKKVSVKDVSTTPKKTEVKTGQPGPERKALPPSQSSSRREKAVAKAASKAQGSTSPGVRVAGAGGVSPLATTKKSAETYSKPASGAPKRPARKTKVTAATPATQKPKTKTSKLDSLLADIRKEEFELDEKTLTSAETEKKEKLVKSMKDKTADFENRYPGRGKEVMYATATKIAKKVAEQMNNKLEGEMIDERRREEKGTPRKPRNPAFELVAKSMGSNRLGVQPRGVKKVPGQKPPVAGEYGGPVSPQKKLEMGKTTKTEIGSRFD
jgi:hypothetical protein